MARYVDLHPVNPQPRLVGQVVEALRDDALIAYPTDSGYALGVQLGNRDGLERIRRLRQLDDKHHFTLVCRDFAQLGQLAHLDNAVFRAVKAATTGDAFLANNPPEIAWHGFQADGYVLVQAITSIARHLRDACGARELRLHVTAAERGAQIDIEAPGAVASGDTSSMWESLVIGDAADASAAMA